MAESRDRWALILGASSGMGEATARALATAGYNIAGIHLDRRPAAEPDFSAAVEGIDEHPHTADGRDRAEEGASA